jgi:hypothetical protein
MIFQLEWGKIICNGIEHEDILFVDGRIVDRNRDSIREKYGTSHCVDEGEAKKLLEGNPKEVIIGNGFEGVLFLTSKAEELLTKNSILTIVNSKQAVEMLNIKIKEGKVNALIHTTC